MKKVLIVAHCSRFLLQFEQNNVRLLQNMGFEVHYATNYMQEDTYENVEMKLEQLGIVLHQIDFVRSPFKITKNVKACRQLISLMVNERFDGIHCHTPMGGFLSRVAAKFTHTTNVIYTAHGFHFYKGAPLINWLLYYPIEWLCSWWTDVQVTITKEDYELANNHFHAKDVKYIPGVGVDLSKFNKNFEKSLIRNELGLKKEDVLFLSVGELNKNKNHIAVINAMKKINNEHIHYCIAGTGELKTYLFSIISKFKLEKRVHLLGFRDDIPELLAEADVYIHPSFREGVSVAIMEAMASGKPIVCANIRGNNDLICSEKSGILVEDNKYSEAVSAILGKKTEWSEMGNYNQKKVQSFSIENVEIIMREIYRIVLGT